MLYNKNNHLFGGWKMLKNKNYFWWSLLIFGALASLAAAVLWVVFLLKGQLSWVNGAVLLLCVAGGVLTVIFGLI